MLRTFATTPRLAAAALVTFASIVTACHSDPPQSPEVGLTHAASPPKLPQPPNGQARFESDTLYNLWLGDSVGQICKGPSPFFEFDSAAGAKSHPTMQVLATCMTEGPLRGQAIRLIGRTDPRGSDAYNTKLGLERAERVKRYLVAQGVDPSRIVTESAGEDAASKSPAEWARDRRVEIQLAK